jgi:hypothetical protein
MEKIEVGLLLASISVLVLVSAVGEHESNTRSFLTEDDRHGRKPPQICARPPRLDKRILFQRRSPKVDARCQIWVAAAGKELGGMQNLGGG